MRVYASAQVYVAANFLCFRVCETAFKVRWSTAVAVLRVCWHEHRGSYGVCVCVCLSVFL